MSDQTEQPTLQLVDVPERERYEFLFADDGALVGLIEYRLSDSWIALLHTEVNLEFRGRGFGPRIVSMAFDDVRGRGLKIIPKCPLVVRWLESHPEQYDLLLRPPDDSPPPVEGGPLNMA
jgi:predicted GNAT family acetyltransferase